MLNKNHVLRIFNSIHTPFLVLLPDSPRFTIIDVNRGYLEVTKSAKSELLSHGIFEAFPANPEDPYSSGVENLKASLEHVCTNKVSNSMGIQKYDISVRGTDKFEFKYWKPENIPIFDDNGNIEFIIHSIRDVTDQLLLKEAEDGVIQAEKNLQEINQRIVRILESITDGFYAVNRNWTVTYWNQKAESLLNMERRKALGKNLWDLYPPLAGTTIGKLYTEFHKVMSTGVSKSFQEFYEPLEIWFDITVYPGEEGLSVFFKDISDRKRAEEEKEYLMDIIEKSLNEIYIFDSESLMFTYVNEGALSNIGYSMEQMAEMTPIDIKPAHDVHSYNSIIKPLKSGLESKIIFETYHKRADGTLYPVEIHLQLVEDKSAFLAVILDISDRKRGETEREQLIQELTQNNKDLRQFSYITSHNLRSPITNQESLVNLLDQIPLESRDVREIVDDIRTSTRSLKNTVNDLTEILIIKDNPSIEQEAITFSAVFDEVLQQSRYLIDNYKPLIDTDFDDAPAILFSRAYLESIFLNLLTNALKFRSPDRELKVTVKSADKGDHILLEFQDNGIGLDLDKYEERFFGLYQIFHSHTDSKGLGLFLVKSQVESLGGRIEAKSDVDKGMTILIRFRKSAVL